MPYAHGVSGAGFDFSVDVIKPDPLAVIVERHHGRSWRRATSASLKHAVTLGREPVWDKDLRWFLRAAPRVRGFCHFGTALDAANWPSVSAVHAILTGADAVILRPAIGLVSVMTLVEAAATEVVAGGPPR